MNPANLLLVKPHHSGQSSPFLFLSRALVELMVRKGRKVYLALQGYQAPQELL